MTRKELLEKYTKLNNSYTKTLVFHIGERCGFFSEYNGMILAMLYCLSHKIKFVLYSNDANFSYKDGWMDYFEPFCEETYAWYHKYFNMRSRKICKLKSIGVWHIKGLFFNLCAQIIKPFVPFSYYTQDLWVDFFKRDMIEKHYVIPELGINGNMVEACNKLVELTWCFNSEVETKIKEYVNIVGMPNLYYSVHIRRGDKNIETNYISLENYMKMIKNFKNNIKDIFVLTDDYQVMSDLNKKYSQYMWHTLCDKKEHGYVNAEFKSSIDKRNALIRLFSSVELIYHSQKFIGTMTSNPSIFMSIYRPNITMGVDSDESLIYYLYKKR